MSSLPAGAQYIERVDVSIANIDVVVTDRRGEPVRGLTQDDFLVFEDGKPQTITNFSAYASARDEALGDEPGEQSKAAVRPATAQPRPRLIILFIDIDEIEPIRRKQFFEGLGSFFDSSFRDGDMATILSWSSRVHVLVPPTSNRQAVDQVVDVLARSERWSEAEVLRRAAEFRIEQARMDAEFASSLGMGDSGLDPQAEVEFQEWLLGEQRCSRIKRKANEVRNIITSIVRVDMQKLLIFASDDFSERPIRDCDTGPAIDALADAANAYGVTVHAFHPPGARSQLVIGPERGNFLPGTRDPAPMSVQTDRTFNQASGLLRLASQTGGLSAVGAGMSARKLDQAADELENYYSIGYRFSAGNEDRPRKVEVRTKNRSYRVRARQSVVRLSETARLRDELTANLYLPPQHQSQSPGFEARIEQITRDGRFSLVHMELSISARDLVALASTDEKRRGSFSVFVVAGRQVGDASPVAEMTHDFEVVPGAEDSRVMYGFGVRVRPDTRRLSIAVRDNISGEVSTRLIMLAGGGSSNSR